MDSKHIRPVFTLELGHKILPGLVTIGKYDGSHPCLTCATNTDKILIHNPHRKHSLNNGKLIWSETNREIALLNATSTVTSILACPLTTDSRDVLVIGTSTSLLVYDAHDNKDIFYKDLEDGARSVTFDGNILLVGGNSSVHGYNQNGDDIFWMAIGDVVTSMLLMAYTKEGANELIVSAEDFTIKVFKDKELMTEHNETEVVTLLAMLPNQKFAYAVNNGTVGVYENKSRLWRVKSKNFAIAMLPYDLFGQNQPQLITGWSNGKIDCRHLKTGEVIFKDSLSSSVAGIVEGDYRSVGKADLICVSIDGEVRGLTTTKMAATGSVEQDTIRELLTQKQGLMMELKHYDNNVKYNSNILNETDSFETTGVIPSTTRLQIVVSTGSTNIEVYICTNNSTIIRAAILFAEGIFSGESHVVHPEVTKLSSGLSIPLYLKHDKSVDVHLKALVGYANSVQFHVFEITKQLPQFSMYRLKDSPGNPSGWVRFHIQERLQRVCMWINQNFVFPQDVEFDSGPDLIVSIEGLRDQKMARMHFEISGKTTFYTDSMFLASDLVQSLSNYLKLDNLESTAMFSDDETTLKELMQKLSDIQEARLKLDTDVADQLGQIRNLIIKAEDCRINDLKDMIGCYHDLYLINNNLIGGHNVKSQNYLEGVEAMKSINNIIQKASKLRIGQHAATMIGHCRNAIKTNNIEGMIKIIRTGKL